jgi:hypothetical protein
MAVVVVDVEVEAAASVAAMDHVSLHHAMLRRPPAPTALPRHRTPLDLPPATHHRRHSVFRRRHLQRSLLVAASSSASVALEHKYKELGSSLT